MLVKPSRQHLRVNEIPPKAKIFTRCGTFYLIKRLIKSILYSNLEPMQEATDKKLHILDIAEDLFSRNGFDATTTREIAEKSGANVAMISYYFGSKVNLLVAIIERFSHAILSRLNEGYKLNSDPQTRMRSILESYLNYSFDHPDPIMIARRELGVNMRPALRSTIQNTHTQAREMVNDIIVDGQKAGIYRPIDVALLIQSIGSMVDSMVNELHNLKRSGFDLCEMKMLDIGDEKDRTKIKHFIIGKEYTVLVA